MSYSTFKIVQATTASALTADDWKRAWELAAPVVVAAGRYVEVQKEGLPELTEDAHFQLLRALTDYTAASEEPPHEYQVGDKYP